MAYEASSIRQGQSGVGYYTESLLGSLLSGFPDTRFLLLSHRARHGTQDSRVTATQKLSFPIKEVWMQLWVPAILSRHSPDLCHFTNGIAPLYTRFPYVVTLHDLSLIRHPEWHPKSRRLWMRRILRPSVTRASGVICDSEKTRSDLADKLSAELVERLNGAITAVKAALEGKDTQAIRSETEKLQKVLGEAGSAAYQEVSQRQAQQQAGPQAASTGGGGGPGGENVVDADFKVKD